MNLAHKLQKGLYELSRRGVITKEIVKGSDYLKEYFLVKFSGCTDKDCKAALAEVGWYEEDIGVWVVYN